MIFNALTVEFAHEIVLQEIKHDSPGSPWRPERRAIGYRSGAFVALGAMMYNPPAASTSCFLFTLFPIFFERRLKFRRIGGVSFGASHEFGIAAENDVGTTGHVSGDRDRAPRPAWAMISASFSWYLALSTVCGMFILPAPS